MRVANALLVTISIFLAETSFAVAQEPSGDATDPTVAEHPDPVETYLFSLANLAPPEVLEPFMCWSVVAELGAGLKAAGEEEDEGDWIAIGEKLERRAEGFLDELIERVMEEEGIPRRNVEKLIDEVGYGDAFYEFYQALNYYELLGVYTNCVESYMPNGWFSSDISGTVLLKYLDDRPTLFDGLTYAVASSGDFVIDWSRTQYESLEKVDICDVNTDVVGGAAIGTAVTSAIAGQSVLAVISSAGVLVISAPAVAPSITISSLVGASLYLGSKGYCLLAK